MNIVNRIRLNAEESLEAVMRAYEGSYFFEPHLALAKLQIDSPFPSDDGARTREVVGALRAVADVLEAGDNRDEAVHAVLKARGLAE